MPKGNKSEKHIAVNLEEVAKKILALVSDTSPSGCETMQTIFSAAQQHYTSKQDSYLWWMYYWTSTRGLDFAQSISELGSTQTDYLRRQALRNFLTQGELTTTSANFYLLREFIRNLNGYTQQSDYELVKFFPVLKGAILDQINQRDELILAERSEKEAAERQLLQERERIEAECRKIVLTASHDEALQHPQPKGEQIFVIVKEQDNWRIEWKNPYGKFARVVLPGTMSCHEKYSSLQDLLDDTEELERSKITLAAWLSCEKSSTKCLLFSDTPAEQVYNHFLLNTRLKTLYWQNSIGSRHEINCSLYPPLQTLISQTDQWNEEALERVSLLLTGVNTRTHISQEKRNLTSQSIFKDIALRYSCTVIHDFNERNIMNTMRNSIVLCIDQGQWRAAFVGSDLDILRLSTTDLPTRAQSILKSWPIDQKDNLQQRHAFTEAMNEFKPPLAKPAKLKGNYSALESILKKQCTERDTKSGSKDEVITDSNHQKSYQAPERKKLNPDDFSAIQRFLSQHVEDKQTPETPTTKSDENIGKIDHSKFSKIARMFNPSNTESRHTPETVQNAVEKSPASAPIHSSVFPPMQETSFKSAPPPPPPPNW